MTRLLLIRHAQPSEDSSRERCYGRLDVELADEGRRKAAELARALRDVRLDAVYVSPRRRALDTARPLAETRGLVPLVDARLAELDFGELEGRTYDEIAATRPELYRRWMEAPTTVQFPGGDSYATLRTRVLAAVADIRAMVETAAVVTHGGVVRAILAHCLGMPDAAIFALAQDYGGVSVVDWFGETPLVRVVNTRPEWVAQGVPD